jgi:hypothetical protein
MCPATAMQAKRGRGVYLLLVLDIDTIWGEWSASRPNRPWGKDHQYPLDGGLGRKRSWPNFKLLSRHSPGVSSPSWDLNLGPLEYEAEVCTAQPRRSVLQLAVLNTSILLWAAWCLQNLGVSPLAYYHHARRPYDTLMSSLCPICQNVLP